MNSREAKTRVHCIRNQYHLCQQDIEAIKYARDIIERFECGELVEIVRCQDCKNKKMIEIEKGSPEPYCIVHDLPFGMTDIKFCSLGEGKEKNK